MPITASDLALFGSTGRPLNDVDPVGGSWDTGARPLSMQLSSAQAIELISSSSGDTRTAEIVYRTTAGETYKWSPTLAGTCAVALSTGTPEILLTVALSSAHATRTVTLRGGGDGAMVHTINPGEVGAFAMFPYSYSKASSAVVRYEKLFLANLSTEATLYSGTVRISSDASTQFRVGVSAAVGGTSGWANRLTAPAGISFADTTAVSLPADLGPGEAVGVVVEQTLAAGATSAHPTFLLTLGGMSLVST